MNQNFINEMKILLGDEYEAFYQSLDNPMYRGLSLNTSKCDEAFLLRHLSTEIEKSPFAKTGYILKSDDKLGNHWTHLSGCYYLQEPSASSAVEILGVEKHDKVLDLCAAPGGKSGQILSRLDHTGLLISNELDHARALVLMSNCERLGFGENLITQGMAQKLCKQFHNYFDKILVDAPCSGEGMMKKHELAKLEWSIENNHSCAARQLDILDHAVEALKEGGILVYSTCTYSQIENEAVIYEFLQKHPECELVDCGDTVKRRGIPYQDLDISKVRRIFPMDQGEGHFIAKMRKITSSGYQTKLKTIKEGKIEACVKAFLDDQLTHYDDMHIVTLNQKVYMKQTPFIQLDGINILRQGICIGEIIKGRFEPHQHFYTSSLLRNRYKHIVELDEKLCTLFLQGEVLPVPYKGYVALCHEGICLGFGKGDGNQIKNKYPKGLRVRT